MRVFVTRRQRLRRLGRRRGPDRARAIRFSASPDPTLRPRNCTAAGAEVHRGSLDDVESLKSGAAEADGVIHCAFIHDFSKIRGELRDRQARHRDVGRRARRLRHGRSSPVRASRCSARAASRPRRSVRTPGAHAFPRVRRRRRWRPKRSGSRAWPSACRRPSTARAIITASSRF